MTEIGKAATVDLSINVELTRRLIVEFIRARTSMLGIRRVVLGLSGGIDSALCAYLASEALGAENVIGILMPYKTSTADSHGDAMLVAHELGIQHQTIEITPMVDPFFELFPDISAGRKGNVMARERMIILYDQSVALGPALVVGTSNKTESLLGYFTLYGDGAAAIEPIGDLYKTQVRQLSRAIGVPEPVCCKAPSADLWPGQTDEGEIGTTYEEMDQILYLLIDREYAPQDVIRMGFDKAQVERLHRMIYKSEFKRHTPLVAKLGTRSIGHDLNYPLDWGAR